MQSYQRQLEDMKSNMSQIGYQQRQDHYEK